MYLKFLLGFCGLLMIFTLLLGPILLYSNLNPIGYLNPVKSATIQLGIHLNETHVY